MLTKELIKKLMRNKDEIRGIDFKTDADFVLKEKGKKGLKKVEKRMAELGYPIKYKEIFSTAFYPIGLRVLCLLVIKGVFDWNNKKIKEMGEAAPKFSLFIKILMRFLGSLRELKKEVKKTWMRYHTTGEMGLITPRNIDFKTLRRPGGGCRIKLTGHKIHPVYCIYLSSYLAKTCEMVIRGGPVKCKETKCPFKGDKYHEFVLKW